MEFVDAVREGDVSEFDAGGIFFYSLKVPDKRTTPLKHSHFFLNTISMNVNATYVE